MPVYYNDLDPFCCKVLEKNIRAGNLPGGWVDGRDIRAVRATELVGYRHIHLFAGIGAFPLAFLRAGVPLSLRIITGGFPCTDISNAGKRAGITGAQSGLWFQMVRLLQEMLDCDMGPDYVCVENVSALVNRGLSTVLGDLAQIGYDAEWQVLRASDFGAPHRRERLFLLAYPSRHARELQQSERQDLRDKPSINGAERSLANVAYPGRTGRWQDAGCSSGDEAAHEGGAALDDYQPDGDGQGDRASGMADSNGLASGLWGRSDGQARAQVGCGGAEMLADPDLQRCKECNAPSRNGAMGQPSGGAETYWQQGIAESGLGRTFTRIPTGMDGDLNDARYQTRSSEILPLLQSSVSAQTIQQQAGGLSGIPETPVLQCDLFRTPSSQGATDIGGTQETIGEVSGGILSDMFNDIPSGSTSPGQRSLQHYPIEPHNLVRILSYEMALAEWEEAVQSTIGLHVLRSALSQIRDVPKTLSTLQTLWQSLSDQEKSWVAVCASGRMPWPAGPGAEQYEWEPPRTVSGKLPHRIARLKALGNAIVVPCAEYMTRLIVERERHKGNREDDTEEETP